MPDRSARPRVIAATDPDAIRLAVAALRAGEVIAIPTDTVYGFAASIDRVDALERLYAVKQRPAEKAIPVLLRGPENVAAVARALHPPAAALARRFWPGALTLVVEARPGLPERVTATDERGRRTVALRVPDHPVALAIVAAAGGALAVTSANRSGEPPALEAEALAGADPAPDLIVDGGRAPGGVPSTIVLISDHGLEVLREGAISRSALEAALGDFDRDVEASRFGAV